LLNEAPVKKGTSINSISDFHKEKEMADFRKWLLAFAVVALLSSLAVTANAQSTNLPFTCNATQSTPTTIRTEGITEQVGDYVVTCSGGQPAAAGANIAKANISIFLSTTVTSRLLSGGPNNWTEAILFIDDPHTASNPNRAIQLCTDAVQTGWDATTQTCNMSGVGAGVANTTYDPGTPEIIQAPNPAFPGTAMAPQPQFIPTAATRPNAFLGRINQGAQGNIGTNTNSIVWLGIPLDPPGTAGLRTLRITNVRGNAPQISSNLIPVPITMFISITGAQAVTVNNSSQTVAFVQQGLVLNTSLPNASGPPNTFGNIAPGAFGGIFQQCQSNNPTRFATGGIGPFDNGITFFIRINEGFGSAFKRRINTNPIVFSGTPPAGYPNVQVDPVTGNNATSNGAAANQDIPGSGLYGDSESGITFNRQLANDPNESVVGVAPLTGNFPSSDAFNGGANSRAPANAGIANTGTRILITFNNIPNGIALEFPSIIYFVNPAIAAGSVAPSGRAITGGAVFVATDSTGSISNNFAQSASSFNAGFTHIVPTNGTVFATYEVINSAPDVIEQSDIPVVVTFIYDPTNNLPQPNVQATVNVSFAPVTGPTTASSSAPIPRFRLSNNTQNAFIVNKCQCNLLFPFITNQSGFDTGIAIANTSADPYTPLGGRAQTGTIQYFFYGNNADGSPVVNPPVSQPVKAGDYMKFSLMNGGDHGMAPMRGFEGYMFAQANFQFCHGFAFISDIGAQRVAEGYLGIEIDDPIFSRTGQSSETKAH